MLTSTTNIFWDMKEVYVMILLCMEKPLVVNNKM